MQSSIDRVKKDELDTPMAGMVSISYTYAKHTEVKGGIVLAVEERYEMMDRCIVKAVQMNNYPIKRHPP